jgi:plastocyanin
MRTLVLCALVAALAGACGDAEEQIEEAVEEIDEATGVDTLEGPGEAGPEPYRVILQAASYAYQPSEITVPPHGPVRFIVANGSDIAHGFEIEGHGMEEEIAEIAAGSSDSLTVEFHESGEYVIYCPVDDHRQRGMTGTVTVQ